MNRKLLVVVPVVALLTAGATAYAVPDDTIAPVAATTATMPTTCVVAHRLVDSWDSDYFCGSPFVRLPVGWERDSVSDDDPRFDCATMGDHVCGPNAVRPPALLAELGAQDAGYEVRDPSVGLPHPDVPSLCASLLDQGFQRLPGVAYLATC